MRSEWVDENKTYCEQDENGTSVGNPVTQWNYILGCYKGSIADTQVLNVKGLTIPSGCRELDGSPTTSPSPSLPNTSSPPTPRQDRPNIIIFQPDDLKHYDTWSPPPNNPNEPNYEVSEPSDGGLPFMNLLREEGMEMKQAYTASPACGTSRFSTITGKYASRAESGKKDEAVPRYVTIPSTKLIGLDCKQNNVAAAFKRSGLYRTAMFGKWHLAGLTDEEYSYEIAKDFVENCGFDSVGGLYVENLSDEIFGNFNNGNFSHNMEWMTSEAIQFIEENTTEPFFMYFNPTVPHVGHSVDYAFQNFTCMQTPSGILDEEPIKYFPFDTCQEYRDSVYNRSANLDELGPIYVDDSLGAILEALNATGKLNNTLIIFQQDHGIETKKALYENGIRVAQFAWYPGKIQAGVFDKPVSSIDIAATVLDFSGIDVDYLMDGISWKEEITAVSSSTFSEFDERCLFFEMEYDRSVRCGCDKFTQIVPNGPSTTEKQGIKHGLTTDEENLYDLCGGGESYVTADGSNYESNNIAARYPNQAIPFQTLMECHLERTSFETNPEHFFKPCILELFPTTSPAPSVSLSPTTCPSTEIETTIEVKTDNRAKEHKNKYFLSVVDEINGSNSILLQNTSMLNNHVHYRTACLDANACYNFTFTDKRGDGICCDFGEGYYKINFGDEEFSSSFEGGYKNHTYFGSCSPSTSPSAPSNASSSTPSGVPSAAPSNASSSNPSEQTIAKITTFRISSKLTSSGNKWKVKLLFILKNANKDKLSDITLEVQYTKNLSTDKTKTCTSSSKGKCKLNLKVSPKVQEMTLEITDVDTPSGLSYDAESNTKFVSINGETTNTGCRLFSGGCSSYQISLDDAER